MAILGAFENGYCHATNVNVRNSPVSGSVLYQAQPNERVQCRGTANGSDGYTWLYVANLTYPSRPLGYIRHDFITAEAGGGTGNLQVTVSVSPATAAVGSLVVWEAFATGNVGTVNWYLELYSPSGLYVWAYSNYVSTIVDVPGTWYVKFTATDAVTNRTVTGGYATISGGSSNPTVGPHTSNNTALTGTALTQNAQCVYDYLRAKGWTKEAVCGILGNMELESTINPGRYGSNGSNTNVLGLVQWSPATKYTNWAAQNGYGNTSMQGQLERILWEVENPGPSGADQWYATSNYNLTFKQFTTST